VTHVLDHVFVLCSEGAAEAEALTRLGLPEGPPNTHPGQGTSCRRFVFENAYLELLWVRDAGEAQSPLTLPTRLFERWSSRRGRASPFGVVLRSAGPGPADPPFPTWPYHPSYLPPGLAIDVAVGTSLSEPEIFYIRAPRRPGALGGEATSFDGAFRKWGAVSIGLPGASRSAALRAVEAAGLVSFPTAAEHVMYVDFGDAPRERTADLRPDLPIVLRYGDGQST
jgi:hypothetical protein